MELIFREIYRLIDDSNTCENSIIKGQIVNDIDFLAEAYLLYVEDNE
jgi:uncharacterized membrane protein